MALNIKDPEVDRLARELATLTGESITESARRAFSERLQRVRARANAESILADVEAVVVRGRQRAAKGDIDTRSLDEILGYDEHGLPG